MTLKPFIAAIGFLMLVGAAQAQTTITITNTITNANPTPFGVNWAEGNANRGLNALNNQTGDAGFGRQIIRMKGTADGGSTTHLDHEQGTSADYYETLYTGMFDGGEIRVYRETPTGITLVRTSTIISFLADTTAPNRKRITFANGPVVQAGDIYVLSKEANADLNQYCHPRLTWIRNGANTWEKKVDDQGGLGNDAAVTKTLDAIDKPYNTNNTTSCKITNTNANNVQVGIGQYFSTDNQSGEFSFDPTKTYRFGVWLKQTGIAGGQVKLETTITGITKIFNVGSTWQYFTYDVSGVQPPPPNAVFDYLRLTFDGAGTLWVDDFTMHDAAIPLFAPKPNIIQELINFKPHCIRIWSGQTNGEMGTNIGDWTDTELQSSRLWSVNQGPTTGAALKLPTILPICEANQIAPYLICSPSFSESDFTGLMEYLYAPITTPLGAKRASQGHPAPYVFTKIYIELGNETWNGLFDPWTYDFNGARYGKFAQYFFNIIKTSPYYNANNVEFLLGGFFVQPDQFGYGQQAVTTAPDGKQMMLANYIGGFDGLNIPFPPNSPLVDSIQKTAFYARWITRNIIDEHITTRNAMAAAGKPYQLGIYEAGPGYALPDPSQPYNLGAEKIGKSLGCAVANLDAFLYQSQKGFGLQNLFLFARGYNWTSHTSEANGLRPHNHFLAMQMRNRYAKGEMITTNITNNPTTFLPLIDDNANGVYDGGYGEAPAGNYENIASYAFKNGADYSVFVLNRNVTQNTPVTLNLPAGTNASNVSLCKLTGDPTGSNIDAQNYTIQNVDLTGAFSGSTYSFTMPAGSIYLFNTSPAPLSVDRIDVIAAKACCGNAQVKWTTINEINNDYFDVEHSKDGMAFEKIGKVVANKSNQNIKKYAFNHTKTAMGINYYRIKQVDFDGKYEYSKVISLNLPQDDSFVAKPNPFTDVLQISFDETTNATIELKIVDVLGRVIYANSAFAPNQFIDTKSFAKGVYLIKMSVDGVACTKKMVKE